MLKRVEELDFDYIPKLKKHRRRNWHFKMSAMVITIFQKSGGYIHAKTALDFKLNFDVIARKYTFQKIFVTYQKGYDPHP